MCCFLITCFLADLYALPEQGLCVFFRNVAPGSRMMWGLVMNDWMNRWMDDQMAGSE